MKMEQKKIHLPENLLASPIYIGQAQRGGIKGGSQDGLWPLLWGQLPSHLRGVLAFVSPIKL